MRRILFLLALIALWPVVAGAQTTPGAFPGAPFVATGGSSAAPLKTRAGDFFDVIADFGATGNGTTDDTTALQNAAAASATRVVRFPCGTYKVIAHIPVPKNGVLLGDTNYAWYYGYTGGTPCVLIKTAGGSDWATANGVLTLGGWTHLQGIV